MWVWVLVVLVLAVLVAAAFLGWKDTARYLRMRRM